MSKNQLICPHFLQGKCLYGDECRQRHSLSSTVTKPPPARKTMTCAFHSKGLCNKGDTCPFFHPASKAQDSWRRAPTSQATPETRTGAFQPCAFYLKGRCTKGDTCPFPHTGGVISQPPCAYYLAGRCRYGAQCSASHDGASYAASPSSPPPLSPLVRTYAPLESRAIPIRPVQEATTKSHNLETTEGNTRDGIDESLAAASPTEKPLVEHEMTLSHCSVVFAAGARVKEVVTPFESCTLIVANIAEEETQESLIRVFDAFGSLETIVLLRDRDTAMARVTYSTAAEATSAIHGLRGSQYQPKTDLKVVKSGDAVLRSTKVKLSWYAPKRIGWAHYKTIARARENATRLDGTKFNSTTIKATFQIPSFRQHTSFSVELRGLPSNTTETNLARFCRSESVTLKPLGYDRDTSLLDVQSQLQEIGPLETFDALPVDRTKSKIVVFAQFAHSEHAEAAVARLHNSKQSYLNHSPMWLERIHAVKYTVSTGLLSAIRDQLEVLAATCEDCKLRFYEPQADAPQESAGIATIRLFSANAKALGVAKRQLEKLLDGERLVDHTGMQVWDEFLVEVTGERFLHFIERIHGVYVKCDKRNRVVHLFGGANGGLEEAREAILERLAELRTSSAEIPIERSVLIWLMRGGMDVLSERFGHEFGTVNIVRRILVVKPDMEVKEVQAAIETRGRAVAVPNVQSDSACCPVCYTDVEAPYTLQCGHAYCKDCLTLMLSTTSSAAPSVMCIFEDSECNSCHSNIDLSVVREFLNPEQERTLFETSFRSYVHSRPNDFKYCPTPDCGVIYRPGDEGTVLSCPSCLDKICAACNTQFHEGLSCSEYKDHREGGERSFREWKAANQVKDCPSCGASIEKVAGCNHMTCLRCQTHMCWVCLKTFAAGVVDSEGGVYAHMRRAHGGIQ